MQPGSNDCLTQSLEALHIQRNVVIDQENGSCPVIAGVANVGQHSVERISMEVAAAHLDDRTETAIESTTARGFNYVHLASQERVSLEHARIPVRRTDLTVLEPVGRPRGIMHPTLAVPIRKAADPLEAGALLQCAQQFAEGDFPFAAHQIVDAHIFVSFGGKAGIVSTHHNLHARPQRAH